MQLRDDSNYKAAVLITDGRPNTRPLQNESDDTTNERDRNNTIIAGANLLESGVYDRVFAIGIRGNRRIRFQELEFIASPNSSFIINAFTPEAFEAVRLEVENAFCNRKKNI